MSRRGRFPSSRSSSHGSRIGSCGCDRFRLSESGCRASESNSADDVEPVRVSLGVPDLDRDCDDVVGDARSIEWVLDGPAMGASGGGEGESGCGCGGGPSIPPSNDGSIVPFACATCSSVSGCHG